MPSIRYSVNLLIRSPYVRGRGLLAVALVGDGELLAALGTTCSEHAAAVSG